MTEPGPITLAYLAAHPHDAARVMETLEPAELAVFIAGVPARLAAPSLAALPVETAGALVEALPADRRAACLRAMNESSREAILERTPSRLARALRHQIGYPSALVGSVMVADMVTVPFDATIRESREHRGLRRRRARDGAHPRLPREHHRTGARRRNDDDDARERRS